MPLYEYKCKKCGHRFEKIVKFSDPPIKKCPNCKKIALEQLVSSPAIQFKGTGWYVTDYAGKSAPPEESSKEESGKKGEETKSTEQKADEKSDQKSKDQKKDAAPKEAPAKAAKESKSTEKATADKRR